MDFKVPYFLLIIVMIGATPLHAQTGTNNYEGEHKPLLYKNTVAIGLTAHSAGWGVDFRRGKNITAFKKRILEIEAVGIRHPKQIKSVNP